MTPLRIVFLVRSLGYGGAERQMVALASALDRRRFAPSVVCFYAGGPLERDLVTAGVPVTVLSKRGRWDVFGFLARLIAELRRLRPQIIHSYLEVPNCIAVLVRPFLPGIAIVWGIRNSNMDLNRYDWFARAGYHASRFLCRWADLIIVNSESGRRWRLDHGFPPDRMLVIPNGIDTRRFRPRPEARPAIRAAWGVGEDTWVIGLVARLDPMKGHEDFLRAAALLMKLGRRVLFVCVGDGDPNSRSRLEVLAKYLGLADLVRWEGARDDMPELYSALDVLTSPSRFGEGFSNAIGEAMACGVPCVATDVGDAGLILGPSGALTPPGRPDALAVAWRDMLSEGRAALAERGRSARARIEDLYSVERLVVRTESALLNSVASQGLFEKRLPTW